MVRYLKLFCWSLIHLCYTGSGQWVGVLRAETSPVGTLLQQRTLTLIGLSLVHSADEKAIARVSTDDLHSTIADQNNIVIFGWRLLMRTSKASYVERKQEKTITDTLPRIILHQSRAQRNSLRVLCRSNTKFQCGFTVTSSRKESLILFHKETHRRNVCQKMSQTLCSLFQYTSLPFVSLFATEQNVTNFCTHLG